MKPIQRILVPVDGSEHAVKAAAAAAHLAQNNSAELFFLYVTDIRKIAVDSYLLDQIIETHERMGDSILAAATQNVPEGVKARAHRKEGDPADVIVSFAKQNEIDLIVMGTRGLGAIKGTLLGSVSQEVLQRAECSVLIHK